MKMRAGYRHWLGYGYETMPMLSPVIHLQEMVVLPWTQNTTKYLSHLWLSIRVLSEYMFSGIIEKNCAHPP